MTRTIHTISAVLLTLCACKQSGNPSVSDDIVLGIIADLTGATADVGKPYNEGMLAYIDDLNAKGGLKGRK
jgi:branched-chain amino acid transport system substrate-binding protein